MKKYSGEGLPFSLPVFLTDSDAVVSKHLASNVVMPDAVDVRIKELQSELREERKKNAKIRNALMDENDSLKETIKTLEECVEHMRTVVPRVVKVKMIDQAVDATEDTLTEHIVELRKDEKTLRLQLKTLQTQIDQERATLCSVYDVSTKAKAEATAVAVTAFYLRAAQAETVQAEAVQESE